MDREQLTRQNLGGVFNYRLRHACNCRAVACVTKLPNLKLKTWPKRLLGSLLLVLALPNFTCQMEQTFEPAVVDFLFNYAKENLVTMSTRETLLKGKAQYR
jgi:hypothetical protein